MLEGWVGLALTRTYLHLFHIAGSYWTRPRPRRGASWHENCGSYFHKRYKKALSMVLLPDNASIYVYILYIYRKFVPGVQKNPLSNV